MKTKAKTKITQTKIFKTVIFFIAVVTLCVVYYFVSPYFLFEKHSSVDKFPLTIKSKINSDLKIHFIDVEQGDCILIITPCNRTILMDAGVENESITKNVVSYLKNLNIKKIDYLIATHPDSDHIGGFKEIFDKFKVKFVFRPYVKSSNVKTDNLKERFNPPNANFCETYVYADFINAVNKERSDWVYICSDTDLIFDYGEYFSLKIDFLTPTADLKDLWYNDLNDYSPIIKLSFGSFTAIFTGDASNYVEQEALNNYSNLILDCDLLKVAHHGASTSTSHDFLKSVTPKYAVISCGAGNIYSHPKQSVLTELLNFNCKLFRTDLQGTITFNVRKGGDVSYLTDRNCNQSDLYIGY